MPAYTTPLTAVPGFTLPAADWNAGVRDSLEAVAKPSRCRVRRTAVQSIPTGVVTPVTWTVEDYDTATMWDAAAPTRLTIPETGIYEIKFGAQFTANATGARFLGISKNGSTTVFNAALNAGGSGAWFTGGTVVAEVSAVATDYFSCCAYQTSGGSLNLDVTYEVWASARLVAR